MENLRRLVNPQVTRNEFDSEEKYPQEKNLARAWDNLRVSVKLSAGLLPTPFSASPPPDMVHAAVNVAREVFELAESVVRLGWEVAKTQAVKTVAKELTIGTAREAIDAARAASHGDVPEAVRHGMGAVGRAAADLAVYQGVQRPRQTMQLARLLFFGPPNPPRRG